MILSLERIQHVSRRTGFNMATVEKVIHLMNLLEAIEGHPVLRGKFALKGGTALNLFVFSLPRLSVDIDLNLIEPLSRAELEAIRPRFGQAFEAVFRRKGFTIRKSPTDHAGGKWRLGYRSAAGGTSNLEVDVNYVLRRPLWEPAVRDSASLGEYAAKAVRVLSEAELAGGKLSALFSRVQARDLFDAHQLLTRKDIDPEQLHVAFVVYGGFNRVDWRTINLDRIDLSPTDVERMLLPTVQPSIVDEAGGPDVWIGKMISETRERLTGLVPLRDGDLSFLDALLDRGEIRADLLTADPGLQEKIRTHPMLNWKMLNVRKHRGL